MEKTIKARQLKDDAILNIKVNKTFYLMSKSSVFSVFSKLYSDKTIEVEEFVKSITSKKFEEMNETERNFYVLTLLVSEIEKQAQENDAFIETEYSEKELKEQLEKIADNPNEG